MDVLNLNEEMKSELKSEKLRLKYLVNHFGIRKRNIQNWIKKGKSGLKDKRKTNTGRISRYTLFDEDFSKDFPDRLKAYPGKYQQDIIFKFLMPKFLLDKYDTEGKTYGFKPDDI